MEDAAITIRLSYGNILKVYAKREVQPDYLVSNVLEHTDAKVLNLIITGVTLFNNK